jgi:hypothetical protein
VGPEDHLIEPLIDPESAPALALKEDYSLLGCMRPTFFFGNVRATMPNSNPQSCRFHLYSFLPLKLEASAVPGRRRYLPYLRASRQHHDRHEWQPGGHGQHLPCAARKVVTARHSVYRYSLKRPPRTRVPCRRGSTCRPDRATGSAASRGACRGRRLEIVPDRLFGCLR